MVNELDVFDALKHLTDVSNDDYQQTVDLCRQCFDSLKKELKRGADFADPRVISAAAARAFYMLCIKEKSADYDSITSFKAGDVSVSHDIGASDEKIKSAKVLCEEAAVKLIPLMDDNGFFVGKVDI